MLPNNIGLSDGLRVAIKEARTKFRDDALAALKKGIAGSILQASARGAGHVDLPHDAFPSSGPAYTAVTAWLKGAGCGVRSVESMSMNVTAVWRITLPE